MTFNQCNSSSRESTHHPLSGFHGYQACTPYTDICAGTTPIYIKVKTFFKEKNYRSNKDPKRLNTLLPFEGQRKFQNNPDQTVPGKLQLKTLFAAVCTDFGCCMSV